MRTLVVATVLAVATLSLAQDDLTPLTPIPTRVSEPVAKIIPAKLCLQRFPGAPEMTQVEAHFMYVNAEGGCARDAYGNCLPSVPVTVTGAEAATLIQQLNTANLTNNSLFRRIAQHFKNHVGGQ